MISMEPPYEKGLSYSPTYEDVFADTDVVVEDGDELLVPELFVPVLDKDEVLGTILKDVDLEDLSGEGGILFADVPC
jgi:hypothetical protein